MRRLGRKGQSTLEYLLVLAGIIASLVLFQNVVKTKVSGALNTAGDKIDTATTAALDDMDAGTGR